MLHRANFLLLSGCASVSGMRSPYVSVGLATPTPGLENLGLRTPTPALKNLDSDSALIVRLQVPTTTQGLIV